MKGNLSRTTFYNPVNGIHNMIHLRLSFDETFDDESYYGNEAEKWTDDKAREQRKKRTFASLDGLEIKWNRNYDNAYVRQRYSYEMFRNFGVPAPQSSFANLRLGDENYGVFFIGEPVDKKFIERYIDEEEQGGDLYKGGWTNTPANYTLNMTYGVADKDEGDFYNMELKTNKSTSEHKNMENLLDMLNSNDTTKEDFETRTPGTTASRSSPSTSAPRRGDWDSFCITEIRSEERAVSGKWLVVSRTISRG